MTSKKLYISFLLLALSALTACRKELPMPTSAACDELSFAAQVSGFDAASATKTVLGIWDAGGGDILVLEQIDCLSDAGFTKAAPSNAISTFYVHGFLYEGAWDGTQKPNYLFKRKVTVSGATGTPEVASGQTQAVKWPGGSGRRVRFYAYTTCASGSVTRSTASDAGVPYFIYTVPTDPSKEYDIKVAASPEYAGDNNAAASLTFNHVCSAVQISSVADGVKGTFASVSLKGIKNCGKCGLDGIWSDLSGNGTFTKTLSTAKVSAAQNLVTGDDTWMMIPQTLGSGARIELVFSKSSGGGDITATVPLSGRVWEAGHKYLYRLSLARWKEFDLSETDVFGNEIGSTTANCYTVTEAETYTFPLAYGAAVKDGAVNAAAYTPLGGSYASPFVNYLGVQISSPYIETDTGVTAEDACVVWQDTEGMISDVQLKSGSPCRKLQFRYSGAAGNAVIAVRDEDGVIMWSWHIWGRPEGFSTVNMTYGGRTFAFLDCNMGFKGNGPTTSEGYALGTSLYYDWGRKDPFPGTGAWNSTTRAGTTGSYTPSCVVSYPAAANYATLIRTPHVNYLIDSYLVSSKTGYAVNWWNAAESASQNSSDPSLADFEKSVYDPCPIGFCVPQEYILKGVRENYISLAEEVTHSGTKAGIVLGDTGMWPYHGYLLYNNLQYLNSYCQVWSSTNYSGSKAWFTRLYYSSGAGRYYHGHEGHGYNPCPIRPVAEY